jgi:hemoglobin
MINKTHIENLITNFYEQIKQDELLGPIFNDVAKVNWEEHIPLLVNFWSSIMLGTNEYHGGAFGKHVMLSHQTPINKQHFDHWLEIFTQQANQDLPKPYNEIIVNRANMIAQSLLTGIELYKDENPFN